MRGGQSVSSPDGDRWKVWRRWMDQPMPDLRRRFRKSREKAADVAEEGALESFLAFDVADNVWVTVAVAVGLVLIVFVLLPLIGVALELIALLAVLSSGIVGRLVLRRPWIVEAANLDHPERSAAFGVKGWRRSSQAIEELSGAISTAGLPDRLSEGVRVGTPTQSVR